MRVGWIHICWMILNDIFRHSAFSSAGLLTVRERIPVIFDTDIGDDVDDVPALSISHVGI